MFRFRIINALLWWLVLVFFVLVFIGCEGPIPLNQQVVYPPKLSHPACGPFGYVAYINHGIYGLDSVTGGYQVDPDSAGIWIGRLSHEREFRLSPSGSYPAWSHSGEKIAFIDASSLFCAQVDSSDHHTKIQGRLPQRSKNISWSFSDSTVFFESDSPDRSGRAIFAFDLENGSYDPIKYDEDYSYTLPVAGQTGSWFFCIKTSRARVNGNNNVVVKIVPETGQEVSLFEFSGYASWLSTGQDDELFALEIYGTDGEHVIQFNNILDGSQFIVAGENNYYPSVVPDASGFVYQKYDPHYFDNYNGTLWLYSFIDMNSVPLFY